MLTTHLFLAPMLRVGWNWTFVPALVRRGMTVTPVNSVYLTFVSGRHKDFICNRHKRRTLNYHVGSVLRSCAPASSESAPLLQFGLLFVEVLLHQLLLIHSFSVVVCSFIYFIRGLIVK
jgi:hypothetical protein